jgi:HEPN domain-containing protein
MAEDSVARLLLESAGRDASTVDTLAGLLHIHDSIVGFHAQQAVEKYLKAVLSAQDITFRRTHDLVELLDVLADHKLPPPPHADSLDELNPYAVEARYGLTEPSGPSRDALPALVKDVRIWAESQIRLAP